MSFVRKLARLFPPFGRGKAFFARQARAPEYGRDCQPALRELSHLLAERHGQDKDFLRDTADIALALGNLFRAQGDIDRAVSLREAVLAGPGKSPENRAAGARAYFELGCDYRKAGFIDRTHNAFREAAKLGFPSADIAFQLAQMYADSGDFAAAAAEYSRLGLPHAEAAFLVREAREAAASGKDEAALRLIRNALDVYPGSPEAWAALASMDLLAGDAARAVKHSETGLKKATEPGRLILMEELYAFATGPAAPEISPQALEQVAKGMGRALGNSDSVVMCYYAGLFLQLANMLDEAEQCHAKALVLDPDFWAARLAVLALCAGRERLPPLISRQVAFFTEQGAVSKRFLCPSCGMRRETIFSECPRCRAWHSAAFRMRLNEL